MISGGSACQVQVKGGRDTEAAPPFAVGAGWYTRGEAGRNQGRCNFEMATPTDWFLPTRSHLLKIPPTSKGTLRWDWAFKHHKEYFTVTLYLCPPPRLIVIKMYLVQLHKSQCLYRNTVQKSKVSGSAGKGACIQADPRTYMVEGESRLAQVILWLQHALHGTCMCPST